ncbi:hypothetical protein CP533_0555 [Ophiocordyceps camponoti-saundersi (nom. inval.)]|nr:hypothetical protein CP533_0555 [Ophiocordyceps camponoti-saundersi (nom. inval.)]
MASSAAAAATTHEFLIIIPDKPGSQAKRKEIRAAIVCRAQSEHHVRTMLAEDIYFSEGVWDLEKAHIYPFKCVFRNP